MAMNFGGLGRLFGRQGSGRLGGASNSGIQLSNSSFAAGSAQNTAIGTLSVAGGTGTYTFTLTNSASNKAQVAGTNGVNLQAGSASAPAGAFNITVHADNGAGSTFDRTFSISATAVPANTVVPAITGSAVQGATLTSSTGTWTGYPTPTYTYQWKRAGSPIGGATSSTYVVQNADVGSAITVTVTGTNSVGNASATSSATATVTKTTLSYTPVTTATNGSPYTGATPSTSGGTAPYVYSISAGTLPTGLALNTSTGVISGTPTVNAAYSGIVLTVTDANGVTDSSASFTITVSNVLPALSIPTTNLIAAYSMMRVNSWAGNCLEVTRASDNTTQTIGFSGNTRDKAAEDTFAAGSQLTVSQWFDQGGSNNAPLAFGTVANQPLTTSLNEHAGIRPITLTDDTIRKLEVVISATLNRRTCTVYLVLAPRTSWLSANYFDFGDTAIAASVLRLANANPLPRFNVTAAITPPRILPAQMHVLGYSSSATGFISRCAGQELTGATALTSLAIGSLRIGRGIVTADNERMDLLGIFVYAASDSSATMQAFEAAAKASFALNTTPTKKLIYGGSSLIVGVQSTLGQQPWWQTGFGRPAMPDWDVTCMAISGQQLTAEYTTYATIYSNQFDGTKSKNVCIFDAPSNDFNATAYTNQADAETANAKSADNIYTGTTLAFVSQLKAAGFSVVVPTCIARSGLTTANFKEYARLRYNANVIAGAAANGYTVSDRAADSRLSNPLDLTYFYTDGTHLINAGYAILGGIDKTAILAA